MSQFTLSKGVLLLACLLATSPNSWGQRFGQPNYSLIVDSLYMGGIADPPPPRTRAVLNLCSHRDDFPCEVYAWEAIPDAGPAPSLRWLREQVEFVDAQLRAGRTTFVHCQAGRSRSGMVVIAYLMYTYNWPRDRAFSFVRSRRPETRPNQAFMDRLSDWERELRRGKTR